MKTYDNFLLEMFDTKLPLKKNEHHESMIKQFYPHLSDVGMYSVNHNGRKIDFASWKHDGAHEVHFGDFSDPEQNRTHEHSGAGAAPLIGTAIHLYKEKLDQGHPIRFYAKDDNSTYLKVLKHLAKGKTVHHREVKDFIDPNGIRRDAVEVSYTPFGG
jgi:hypothetical protein